MSDSTLNPNSTAQDAQPQVLSVESLNRQIRGLIETRFVQVWVKGELSNFKPHSSGHFYFSLKDQNSQIRAVMFRGHNSRLRFKPYDGLEVIVRGKISVYEPRGEYQITCDMMEPVGAGALQKAFEQLKLKLKTEGLFDAARKKPIPSWPKHIAIVTSPTGAAIRDILNILERRARGVEITIVPSVVQGEAAAPHIREAYQKAIRLPGVEVVIIGRGGGSIEDMWCFNDEQLARMIAASPVPTISAVGHEIDFTICDFVSDLRAPTPSAAAELVVKSAEESFQKIQSLSRLLALSFNRKLMVFKQRLNLAYAKLEDPQRKLQDLILRSDDLWDRMQNALDFLLRSKQHRLDLLVQKLGTPENYISKTKSSLELTENKLGNIMQRTLQKNQSRLKESAAVLDMLSPLKVVDRGYAIASKDQVVLKTKSQVNVNDQIEIRITDAVLHAQVSSIAAIKR